MASGDGILPSRPMTTAFAPSDICATINTFCFISHAHFTAASNSNGGNCSRNIHQLYNNSTHRLQTSTNAKIWKKNDPGFKSRFSDNLDPDVRRVCPNMLRMHYLVVVSHFARQLWYKSAIDCMRNSNRCPQIPYSSVVKKMKKCSGIHTLIWITTKS